MLSSTQTASANVDALLSPEMRAKPVASLSVPPGYMLVLREKGTNNFVAIKPRHKTLGDAVKDAEPGIEFTVGLLPAKQNKDGGISYRIGLTESAVANFLPYVSDPGNAGADMERALKATETQKDVATIAQLLPPEVQMDVHRRIVQREERELPAAAYDERSKAALPAVGALILIALTIQLIGVPYSALLLGFNLGVPALMLWFAMKVVDDRERAWEQRRRTIATEEWARAVGAIRDASARSL